MCSCGVVAGACVCDRSEPASCSLTASPRGPSRGLEARDRRGDSTTRSSHRGWWSVKRRRSLYPAASQLTLVCPGRLSRPNSVVVLLLVPVRCCKRDFHIHEAALRQRASGRGGIIIRRRRPPQQLQQQSKTEMDGDRDQPIFLAAGGDTTGSVSTARRLCARGRRVRTDFSTSRKLRSTRPPRETLRRDTQFWPISKKKRIDTAPAATAAFTTTHNSPRRDTPGS